MSPFTETFCQSGSWQENSSQLKRGSSQGLDYKLLSSEGGLLLKHAGDTEAQDKTPSLSRDLLGFPQIRVTCSCFRCLEFDPAAEASSALRLNIPDAGLENCFSCNKNDWLQPPESDRNTRLLVCLWKITTSGSVLTCHHLRAITLTDSCFNRT